MVLFLVALFLPQAVLAAEAIRCGTDDFGNTVCMDKEGVVTSAPPQTGSGVPAVGTADRSGSKPARCGIDSFGNTVCR
ncbi:MAG: hypothetical protein Q8J80_11165 [Gallionella sp.]|nr:hypothetical protein [Gallionella sp.]